MAATLFESLAEVTRNQARLRPEQVALVFEDRTSSYAELDRRASRVANGLRALGVLSQQRVAYLGGNNEFFFEILFGAAKANATHCALNSRLAPPEIAFILGDCTAAVIFVDEPYREALELMRGQLPALRHIITLNARKQNEYTSWRDAQSPSDPGVAIEPDDIAYLLYTSGTTGKPKGAQISHRSVARMRNIEDSVRRSWIGDESDIALVSMPLFHISGSNWAMQFLYRGATCVIQAQVQAASMLQAIADHGITRIFAVPSVLKMMLQDESLERLDCRSLRSFTYGGSPIPVPILQRALARFGCDFVQIYGMTETMGAVAFLPPEDHDPHRPGKLESCGRPFPQINIKIMSPTWVELPPGEVGELCILTPALMSGYWQRPEQTAESIRDGWYRTGDAGYFDADGYLYLVDRVNDMIISGGENVYPTEVENALRDHPSVDEAAVIGVPDDKWGEAVKAVLICRGEAPDVGELVGFLRTRIAAYKIPKSFDFVAQLPRNPSGKILRRQLRDAYWQGKARRVS